MHKWEFYTDREGLYRWRCTASNGEIVGSSSEGYKTDFESKRNAERHGYEGNPDNIGAADRWEFYIDRRGDYRWRRVAANGAIVGSSSEGYNHEKNAIANAERNGFKKNMRAKKLG